MKKHISAIYITLLFVALSNYCSFAHSHSDEIKAKALIKQIKFYEDNSLDSAFIYVSELLLITENLPDSTRAKAYIVVGEVYDNASIFDIAFQYYDKAMVLLPKNDKTLPYLYSKIGELYTSFADYKQSKYYLDLARDVAEELSMDSLELTYLYYDFGTYYWEIGEYDSAENYLQSTASLIRLREVVDYNYLTLVNAELAEVYILNNKLKKAQNLINEIENYPNQKIFSNYTKTYILFVKGTYEIKVNNFMAGISLLNQALAGAKKIGLEIERSNLLQSLIDAYIKTGNYKKAFEHQKQKSYIDRRIINDQNKARIAALEIIHTSERKDLTIRDQEEAISRRENLIWISLVVLILISVLVFLLYRTVLSLNGKNERIETLVQEMHHRVKNNLQVISSLLGLASMRLEDIDAKRAVEDSKYRVKAMSMIHDRLFNNKGESQIEFNSYVRDLIAALKQSYMPNSDVLIELNIPETNFNVDTTLPLGLLINELISNSFKHAFNGIKRPALKVELLSKRHSYTLNVSDNGCGVEDEISLENSNSFGLKLVRLLVTQLKGKIKLSSNSGMNYQIQFSN